MIHKSLIIIGIIFYISVIFITSSPLQHNNLFKNDSSYSLTNNIKLVYAAEEMTIKEMMMTVEMTIKEMMMTVEMTIKERMMTVEMTIKEMMMTVEMTIKEMMMTVEMTIKERMMTVEMTIKEIVKMMKLTLLILEVELMRQMIMMTRIKSLTMTEMM